MIRLQSADRPPHAFTLAATADVDLDALRLPLWTTRPSAPRMPIGTAPLRR
jgi:hypothetical protein